MAEKTFETIARLVAGPERPDPFKVSADRRAEEELKLKKRAAVRDDNKFDLAEDKNTRENLLIGGKVDKLDADIDLAKARTDKTEAETTQTQQKTAITARGVQLGADMNSTYLLGATLQNQQDLLRMYEAADGENYGDAIRSIQAGIEGGTPVDVAGNSVWQINFQDYDQAFLASTALGGAFRTGAKLNEAGSNYKSEKYPVFASKVKDFVKNAVNGLGDSYGDTDISGYNFSGVLADLPESKKRRVVEILIANAGRTIPVSMLNINDQDALPVYASMRGGEIRVGPATKNASGGELVFAPVNDVLGQFGQTTRMVAETDQHNSLRSMSESGQANEEQTQQWDLADKARRQKTAGLLSSIESLRSALSREMRYLEGGVLGMSPTVEGERLQEGMSQLKSHLGELGLYTSEDEYVDYMLGDGDQPGRIALPYENSDALEIDKDEARKKIANVLRRFYGMNNWYGGSGEIGVIRGEHRLSPEDEEEFFTHLVKDWDKFNEDFVSAGGSESALLDAIDAWPSARPAEDGVVAVSSGREVRAGGDTHKTKGVDLGIEKSGETDILETKIPDRKKRPPTKPFNRGDTKFTEPPNIKLGGKVKRVQGESEAVAGLKRVLKNAEQKDAAPADSSYSEMAVHSPEGPDTSVARRVGSINNQIRKEDGYIDELIDKAEERKDENDIRYAKTLKTILEAKESGRFDREFAGVIRRDRDFAAYLISLADLFD